MPKAPLPKEFVSVEEAGKLLGLSKNSVQKGLRNGTFPIGTAFHTHENGKRGEWHYRIPREPLMLFLKTGRVFEKCVKGK